MKEVRSVAEPLSASRPTRVAVEAICRVAEAVGDEGLTDDGIHGEVVRFCRKGRNKLKGPADADFADIRKAG